MSAGATRVGVSSRGWWRRGVRDMPVERGHMETFAVDSRRLVHRRYLESRPLVRNRGGRVRDRHEVPRVESWHQWRALTAGDPACDLDDHSVTGLSNIFCALCERDALLERSQERGEVC